MNKDILACIGDTPLAELSHFVSGAGLQARIFAKLEFANPFGSVKDRAALFMIEAAEAAGRLKPGATIIEPTSGNTGIGLAGVAAVKGYRTILTMPETMTEERRRLLAAHGAELVLTEGAKGMAGAIARAKELAAEIPGSFIPGQFDNPANAMAHYRGTGPEIVRQLDGDVAAFVAGVGSGGTVTGVGRYLKERGSKARIVGVEPAESPVLGGGKAGPHKIQGIGAGFVPSLLDRGVMDEVMPVTGAAAYEMVRMVALSEGLLIGISGGAALAAAAELAARAEFAGGNIVIVFPDSGERYMSTGVFDNLR